MSGRVAGASGRPLPLCRYANQCNDPGNRSLTLECATIVSWRRFCDQWQFLASGRENEAVNLSGQSIHRTKQNSPSDGLPAGFVRVPGRAPDGNNRFSKASLGAIYAAQFHF